MNAERILIAAECIGDARWFIEKAADYANEREVFDRPIGQNQGVQFPIARAYAETEAADLMVRKAAALFRGRPACGAEANMAKLLALGGGVGRGRRVHADPWRLRLRRDTTSSASSARRGSTGRADLDQPDPGLHRRARAGPAALVFGVAKYSSSLARRPRWEVPA